jgi:hypothetical protein
VVAVPAQALEPDEDASVVVLELLGTRQRRRPRELAQHLAVAWTADVDLVEERGDRRVVFPEQLEPLERVVVELVELLLRRRGGILHGRDRNRLSAQDSASGAYSCSDMPNVHAVASRGVRISGGTRTK